MPSYKVTKPGFFKGETYKPGGKRSVLTVEKAFKLTPSWLEPIKEVRETKAEKEARLKAEKEAVDKAKQDKVDVDSVTFVEKPSQSGPVETI